MNIRRENAKMVGKLAVITVGMFAFGYALIPLYKRICEVTGINILALTERDVPGNVLTPLLRGTRRVEQCRGDVLRDRRAGRRSATSPARR